MKSHLFLSLLMMAISGMLTMPVCQARETLVIPLTRLMPHPAAIRMQNLADEYRLSFPVPHRFQISQAFLALDFTHSNVLVAKRSQLRVQINGVTIAQWRLEPDQVRRRERVIIPPELLLSGYNELRFLTAQHYTDGQCEAPGSPELWTEINPVQSRLEFQYRLKPAPLSLAGLSRLFDKKLPESTIRLLFPDAKLNEKELNWGGLVAQGIALRLEYTPFRLELGSIEVGDGKSPLGFIAPGNRDTVVIGVRDRLARFLAPSILAGITGPYLGLFPLPGHPERFALLISGRDAHEVGQAASAFTWLNFPLPDARETVIRSLHLDTVVPYQGYPALEPERTYLFRELGFRTVSRTGLKPDPIEFGMFLPPDLFAPGEAGVVFRLHLAYNAGMRRDSLLEMRVNGIFEQAVQLPQEGGAHYRDYRITVPLSTFRPGYNRITFQPLLAPLITGECLYFHTEPLQVTLYEDSRVQMPPAAHYAQLPDFSLLARTGFPYLNQGNGSGMGVRLLNRRRDTVLAAWQLLARFARLNRFPLAQSRLSFSSFADARDLIVVGGHVHSLHGKLFKHAQAGPGDPWHTWPYPAGKVAAEPAAPWWQPWLESLLSEGAPFKPALAPRHVTTRQSGGLGNQALGLAFPHPTASRRLVTAFVAKGDLYPAIRALTQPGLWPQMQGDLILWRKSSRTLAWQRVGKTFYVGEAGIHAAVLFHFSRHPWHWLGAVFAAIVLFAWLTHFLLGRIKRRRHPDAEEIAP